MNGHCGYCGCKITYKEMQVDHIEAVYLHEEELNAGQAQEINSIENYMPACRMCNFYKSTMSVESFRKQLETLTVGQDFYIQTGEKVRNCKRKMRERKVLL